MGNIVVSGSTAFDHIMDYQDQFKNHIHPDRIHILNVCFVIDKLKKEVGGTGLNIAYALGLLGEKSILLSSVGSDFDLEEKLEKYIDFKYLYKTSEALTAGAYITTDKDNNQITAFYPGAMNFADKITLNDVKEEVSYLMVSPSGIDGMMKNLDEGKEKGIKTFFDPGQALFGLSQKHLLNACDKANYLMVNEYEFEEFVNKSGKTKKEVIDCFEKVVVTLGEKGSLIIEGEKEIYINSVETKDVVDPTGAGDSFRGGILKGLNNGLDWETSTKIGALNASYCISKYGTQNYSYTKEEFQNRFESEFGIKIKL